MSDEQEIHPLDLANSFVYNETCDMMDSEEVDAEGYRIVNLRRRGEEYFNNKKQFDDLMLKLREMGLIKLIRRTDHGNVTPEEEWSGISYGGSTFLWYNVLDNNRMMRG